MHVHTCCTHKHPLVILRGAVLTSSLGYWPLFTLKVWQVLFSVFYFIILESPFADAEHKLLFKGVWRKHKKNRKRYDKQAKQAHEIMTVNKAQRERNTKSITNYIYIYCLLLYVLSYWAWSEIHAAMASFFNYLVFAMLWWTSFSWVPTSVCTCCQWKCSVSQWKILLIQWGMELSYSFFLTWVRLKH